MPGRPFRKAFLVRLKDLGGWSPIYGRLADGEPLGKIALDYGCSRSWLHGMLTKDPRRKELYVAARKESAEALVDKCDEAIENAKTDRDALMKVKLQVEHWRWKAQAYDKEQFGDTQGPSVSLNIGELHINALRQRQIAPREVVEALPPGDQT